MVVCSSSKYYRLRLLNHYFNPVDYPRPKELSIDFFSASNPFRLRRSEYFTTSIEEYEHGFIEEPFFQCVSAINRKYGEVAMVAGGFSLMMFLKDRSFKKYIERLEHDDHEFGGRMNKNFRISFPSDVDVFILGKEKEKVANELINLMKNTFYDADDFGVFCSKKYGLTNIVIESQRYRDSNSVPGIMRENYSRVSSTEKYRDGPKRYHVSRGKLFSHRESPNTNPNQYYAQLDGGTIEEWDALRHFSCVNVFQIIVKNLHSTPSDVFSFFDLDCCKIGWFPGKERVKTSIGFIRSLSTGLNYCDLDSVHAGQKHRNRIIKYYNRMNIKTTIRSEPALSRYHTLRMSTSQGGVPNYQMRNFNQDMYVWGRNFGQFDRERNYYRENPEEKRKTFRIFYFKLTGFQNIQYEEVKENVDLPYMAESVGIVEKRVDLRKVEDEEEEEDDEMIGSNEKKNKVFVYTQDRVEKETLVEKGKLVLRKYAVKRCFVCKNIETENNQLFKCDDCKKIYYCSEVSNKPFTGA